MLLLEVEVVSLLDSYHPCERRRSEEMVVLRGYCSVQADRGGLSTWRCLQSEHPVFSPMGSHDYGAINTADTRH